MAKVKLLHFEIVSLMSDGKRIMDYIQRLGAADIEQIEDEALIKCDTSAVIEQYKKKNSLAQKCTEIIEHSCDIRKTFIESFTDFKEIEYSEYRLLTDKADSIEAACKEVCTIHDKIEDLQMKISEERKLTDYYSLWKDLDIPMASRRTLTTSIFIGVLDGAFDASQVTEKLNEVDDELTDVAVEVIRSGKMHTCIVVIAHKSIAERTENALRSIGFTVPDKITSMLPSKAVTVSEDKIRIYEEEIEKLNSELKNYKYSYDDFRFLVDYSSSQIFKYDAVQKSAQTEKTFVIRGYLPEVSSEEIKFDLEKRFLCQIDFSEPDYNDEKVPVLIENGSFAGGVESITDMYSTPSNKDVDPNPIMAFFYYVFFGFMLSDAGYGILMVIFSFIAKKKVKVRGSSLKFANMVFFSGLSTIFWGAMFGGWFGDLIPIICTEFLGYESGPDLAIWMDPIGNSMTLLLYCLGFGILQLFAGLLIRFYMLFKEHRYADAFCDTVPIIIFVIGFAILGAGLIVEMPEGIAGAGPIILCIGAILIVLTGGRSSKSIIGKLGGGLYALYNTTTGYVGDILSYSRLLALSLVTGVVAGAVNMLAAMPGNIIVFVIIFILGHVLNIAINLIGTYVHTNRLQYVEFFSKFYEGSGKTFVPFKLNSKYFIIKEEKKYE